MDLVTEVYRITESFPKDERYSLTDQVRRAAISIPSNIAEGAARKTRNEFIHYLHVARGSLSELDTQLELAKRLAYLREADWQLLDTQTERIDKMLHGLLRQQKSSST
jgi:four helix bundle protein